MLKKDNDLMSGKGEWDEEKHPRDEDGKFVKKGFQSTTSQGNKGNQTTKKDAIKHLVETLKKIRNIKVKEIHSFIKSLDPISLQINGDEIIAEFDRYTADKNLYKPGNSDNDGFRYKLEHFKEFPEFIKDSKYNKTKSETGKDTKQHKGVDSWHYFRKEISTDKGAFKITINIRNKSDRHFIYEVSLQKKKT